MTNFSGAERFAHQIPTEDLTMDRSMWVAASALTAWILIGVAAIA